MKLINLKDEKHFFTKCNGNYRYSTRMFSSSNNIYIAQAEDLCNGINWVLSVVKNGKDYSEFLRYLESDDNSFNNYMDNIRFLANCKTLKEVREEIKSNEEETLRLQAKAEV